VPDIFLDSCGFIGSGVADGSLAGSSVQRLSGTDEVKVDEGPKPRALDLNLESILDLDISGFEGLARAVAAHGSASKGNLFVIQFVYSGLNSSSLNSLQINPVNFSFIFMPKLFESRNVAKLQSLSSQPASFFGINNFVFQHTTILYHAREADYAIGEYEGINSTQTDKVVGSGNITKPVYIPQMMVSDGRTLYYMDSRTLPVYRETTSMKPNYLGPNVLENRSSIQIKLTSNYSIKVSNDSQATTIENSNGHFVYTAKLPYVLIQTPILIKSNYDLSTLINPEREVISNKAAETVAQPLVSYFGENRGCRTTSSVRTRESGIKVHPISYAEQSIDNVVEVRVPRSNLNSLSDFVIDHNTKFEYRESADNDNKSLTPYRNAKGKIVEGAYQVFDKVFDDDDLNSISQNNLLDYLVSAVNNKGQSKAGLKRVTYTNTTTGRTETGYMIINLEDPDDSFYEILINDQPPDFDHVGDSPLLSWNLKRGDKVTVVQHKRDFYTDSWNSKEPHGVHSERVRIGGQERIVDDIVYDTLVQWGYNDTQIDKLYKANTISVSGQRHRDKGLSGGDLILQGTRINAMQYFSIEISLSLKHMKYLNIDKEVA